MTSIFLWTITITSERLIFWSENVTDFNFCMFFFKKIQRNINISNNVSKTQFVRDYILFEQFLFVWKNLAVIILKTVVGVAKQFIWSERKFLLRTVCYLYQRIWLLLLNTRTREALGFHMADISWYAWKSNVILFWSLRFFISFE